MLCRLLIHAFLQCSTAGATSKEPTIQVKRHHRDHRGNNPALQRSHNFSNIVVTRAPTPVAWSEVGKRHNQDHRGHDPGLQHSYNFLNTTLAPTAVAWSGVGCPIAYMAGTAYLGGSTVAVGTMVYECKTGAASGWCTLEAYKPGTGTAWEQAWTLKGSCFGTIAPTTFSPTMYTASPSWPTTYIPTDYTASPFSPNTAYPTWPLEPSLAPA